MLADNNNNSNNNNNNRPYFIEGNTFSYLVLIFHVALSFPG